MKKILCFLLLSAACSSLSASVITYTFSGSVVEPGYRDLANAPFPILGPEAFNVGNPVTGSFSYDTSGPYIRSRIANADSYAAIVDYQLNIGELTFSFDPTNGPGEIQITNNKRSSGTEDQYHDAFSFVLAPAYPIDTFLSVTIPMVIMHLYDGSATLFSDTSLPSTYFSLDDFSGYQRNYINLQFRLNNAPVGYVSMVLTEVSPVPVPASLWFFSSALIGLVSIKLKRS